MKVTVRIPGTEARSARAKDPFVSAVAETLKAARFPAEHVGWLELPERTAAELARAMERGRSRGTPAPRARVRTLVTRRMRRS